MHVLAQRVLLLPCRRLAGAMPRWVPSGSPPAQGPRKGSCVRRRCRGSHTLGPEPQVRVVLSTKHQLAATPHSTPGQPVTPPPACLRPANNPKPTSMSSQPRFPLPAPSMCLRHPHCRALLSWPSLAPHPPFTLPVPLTHPSPSPPFPPSKFLFPGTGFEQEHSHLLLRSGLLPLLPRLLHATGDCPQGIRLTPAPAFVQVSPCNFTLL